MQKKYSKGKVVVTGGAGFVGSNLAKELVNRGFEVHIIDNLISGKKTNLPEGVAFHEKDITNYDSIFPIFRNAEYVFHLAALPNVEYSIQNPIISNDSNIDGTLNVLECSRINNIKKYIFASSCSVYGDGIGKAMDENTPLSPKSPYALQKLTGERYADLWGRLYGLNTISLRLFNIYGPGQRDSGPYAFVIAIFLKLKSLGLPLTITGDGEQKRDFIHIKDVVNAFILAAEKNTSTGDVINIGSGTNHSVNQIAKLIGGEIQYIESRIEPKSTLCNSAKARDVLGWTPTISLEQGIAALSQTKQGVK